MTENLDLLLSLPLPEMHDNGFSNQVAALVELRRLRRDRFVTEILVGLVVMAALILPFTTFGLVLSSAAFTEAGMALIGLSLVAFFLSSLSKTTFQ